MKHLFYALLLAISGNILFSDTLHQSDHPKHTIAVIGTGYVGLITGVCLAEFDHTVICVDTDEKKINLLTLGLVPIYEPGLDILLSRLIHTDRLSFTTDFNAAIKAADTVFVAVGTPMGSDGCADLSAVNSVLTNIIPHLTSYKLICIKSTVPIGIGQEFVETLKTAHIDASMYDIVSNPEFLREGSAVHDFFHPDRIIIGTDSERARIIMKEIYAPLIESHIPCFFTSITSSETVKYASNAFLATKLSFINEIANLCDQTGADIQDVSYGMGLDKRIGPYFLKPGPGFGGSCFPKDCKALGVIGDRYGVSLTMVETALAINEKQKKKPVEKLLALMNRNLTGKTIAVLGLAFKNNTDDIRYSPAIDTISLLLEEGAHIKAYDPQAMENMSKLFPTIEYVSSAYDALYQADAAIIVTEWEEFKNLDLGYMAQIMRSCIIVDSRNLLNPAELQRYNFIYSLMGRA